MKLRIQLYWTCETNMYKWNFLPIRKWLLSLNCLSPFISLPRTSHTLLSLYIFQLNIPSLVSPEERRVFKPPQWLTVSSPVTSGNILQATMGLGSRTEKSIYNMSHWWTLLYSVYRSRSIEWHRKQRSWAHSDLPGGLCPGNPQTQVHWTAAHPSWAALYSIHTYSSSS